MTFPKINLHVHSNFSDGKNSIKQIVQRSLKLGLDFIAITDHYTDSWKAWFSTLKNSEKLSEYLEEISICQNYLKIHDKKLTLFKGIEIDLASSEQFIKKNIQVDKFDLILFEYLHGLEAIAFVNNIIHYWKRTITQTSKFPILGLAHFDPSYFIHGNLDALIKFLKDNHIYFEFNSSYPRFYSLQNELFFQRLKEEIIPVAIGCDSHRLSNLNDIEEPIEMIKYYNLEKNFQIFLDNLKR